MENISKERKLKIGFDAKRLFHNNTGLGNYARTLVKHLHQEFPEHEYHLFTPTIPSSINDEIAYFLHNGFFIHTKPSWQPSSLWRTMTVSNTINQLQLNIYHGLSHEVPYGINPQTKVIVTMHDVIYALHPELFPIIDRWMYQWKYKSSCKRANHIIAISESTKHDVERLYHVNQKMSVAYQSCNTIFQSHPHKTPTKKHFLYVGSINERKGLLRIIEAYNKLPSSYKIPFVVIGSGGSYQQKVLESIEKNNLQSFFRFVGNVPNNELLDYYDDSLCLVLPSLYEGFGIPVIESLFRQRPVITSNTSSLPEACGPGGFTIDALNIESIENAMMAMLDEATWQSMSEKGLEYVLSRFSAKITSHSLMSIYNRLLQSSNQDSKKK